MNKQEKLIWNKLKSEYADNTEVLDVLCGGENAREKQIPKKPLEQQPREGSCEKVGMCPTCKEWWISEYRNYCSGCGQAIDWRNEDE